ncbi:MAG: GNAT family N-acetyltransferase [Pseudomonadota bacterium]
MLKIEIKPYLDDYRDQIIDLILKIQTEEFGVSISLDDQPDLKTIHRFYQKEDGNFWVALHGDRVVGTIALLDIGNKQAALRKMFVDGDYRGKEKGVAHALLGELIAWCKNKKFQEIYLGTTSAYLAAHRFYEKNGFEEIPKSLLPASFPVMQVDSKFYRYKV